MNGPTGTGSPIRDLLTSSAQSAGFWSALSAIVGLVAAAAGGILFLTVDELRNFSASVLIIGLSLLFLALVLSPRAVGMFLLGRQGRFGTNVAVMTIAFFAIAVLANFLLFRTPSRFDLTATRVFTLAPQSVQLLKGLDTKVRANAFFAPYHTSAQAAEDLLNEFARQSNNFTYRFVDPELNRSLALQYDVTEFPTIVFEDVSEGTQQKIVCGAIRECFNFNEQEFITGILVATGVDQKVVYLLTGHKEAAGNTRDQTTGQREEEGFDFAVEGMERDNYRVRSLNLAQFEIVPEDAAVVVIAGPKQELGETDREALTAYITSGGRVIALLDPDSPNSFATFFARWGVVIGNRTVADAVSNVAGEPLTPLLQRANGAYVGAPEQGIRIVEQIDVTFFPEAAPVSPLLPLDEMPRHIAFTPLAATTPVSWLENNIEEVAFDPGEDASGPFVVAATVVAAGTLDSPDPHPPASFVIFGDSDFAENRFFFSSDNADLFLNSINWLAEDYELISIRPKVFPYRELVVNTRERDFIKWSSWFFPPFLMVVIGAFVWWRRR